MEGRLLRQDVLACRMIAATENSAIVVPRAAAARSMVRFYRP
jgi:hypothetical protein